MALIGVDQAPRRATILRARVLHPEWLSVLCVYPACQVEEARLLEGQRGVEEEARIKQDAPTSKRARGKPATPLPVQNGTSDTLSISSGVLQVGRHAILPLHGIFHESCS